MRRRWATGAGLALLTMGLATLGYVGWQLHGTDYVARRQQAQAVDALREAWARPASSANQAARTSVGEPTALIRIPRFGRDYEMPVIAGTSQEALATGVGHFDHAAGPGEPGNFALTAHRVTHGEPLADMPQLRPGDILEVETRSAVYVYRLDTDPNELVVAFDDGWVVDERPDNPDAGGVEPPDHPRLITLTSCAELFHTGERMVAFGHLVQARDKAGPAA